MLLLTLNSTNLNLDNHQVVCQFYSSIFVQAIVNQRLHSTVPIYMDPPQPTIQPSP